MPITMDEIKHLEYLSQTDRSEYNKLLDNYKPYDNEVEDAVVLYSHNKDGNRAQEYLERFYFDSENPEPLDEE